MTAFAALTGGGTAGHVLPALAVGEALVAGGREVGELMYVGAQRGIETRLVPGTGIDATYLDVVGLQRRLTAANLGFGSKMYRATREAIELFSSRRPEVVVSVGGYASMPAVFAARRLGIPIVAVSYDLRPGRATKLTARWAAACAVAFPESPLPRARMTGAPVRQSILTIDRGRDRAAARERLGVPAERFMIAVMGGSQGSGVLNDALADLVDRWSGDADLAIHHVTGERFLGDARPPRRDPDGLLYSPVGYEADMPSVYAAADLLIGRGGASTVHEVAVVGIPAILVPWSGAAENHQALNVDWLSRVRAAIALAENELDDLPSTIDRLRRDGQERDRLAAAAHARGAVHRSGALAELIEEVAARAR